MLSSKCFGRRNEMVSVEGLSLANCTRWTADHSTYPARSRWKQVASYEGKVKPTGSPGSTRVLDGEAYADMAGADPIPSESFTLGQKGEVDQSQRTPESWYGVSRGTWGISQASCTLQG